MKVWNVRGALLVLLFAFLLPLSVSAKEAAEYEPFYDLIYDDSAGLIEDEAEKEAVLTKMEQIAAECHVIFYTTENLTAKPTEEICEAYVAERYGEEQSEPVIMFLIDMGNREIYLYCTGPVHTIVTDGEALSITDNVYQYASSGDYAACAQEAFAESYALAQGYPIKRPMKTINNLLIALFLGFLGNYVVMKLRRADYMQGFNQRGEVVDFQTKIGATTDMKLKKAYQYKYTLKNDTGSTGSDSLGSSGGSGYSGGGGGGGSSSGSSGGGHSF